MKNLEQKVKYLTMYAVGSSLFMGLMLFSSFDKDVKDETFDEITVKRINLVENDGTLRMVISNKEKQHSGRMDGKDEEKRERPAGLMFFNDEGDECGGLIYEAKKNGDKIYSGMSFTMDKYKDDQVVQLVNDEGYKGDQVYHRRGLLINSYAFHTKMTDKENKLAEAKKITDEKTRKEAINKIYSEYNSVNRVFLGQTSGNSSGLFLADKSGKPKMMIYVDDQGNPKFQTFNDKGDVKDFIDNKITTSNQ